MTHTIKLTLSLIASLIVATPSNAETPDEWVQLGTRVHGGFGSFIPAGIRIGLDAVQKLGASPRDLSVVYYSGDKAPCACIVDGIMIATYASPGQGSLQVAAEKSPAGTMGVAIIRHRKTGAGLRYTIAEEWLPKLAEINKTVAEPRARYDAVMTAENLFSATPLEAAK